VGVSWAVADNGKYNQVKRGLAIDSINKANS